MALKPPSEEPLDLDVDLSQVDTSMPVLPGGLYDLRIHDVVKEENKEKSGFNAVITFVTTEPTTSIQGKEIAAGFPLKAWYHMQNKATAADHEQWKQNFAMLLDAALGTTQGDRPKFSKSIVLNKIVRANLKIENDDNGRPTNKVGNLTKPE